MPLDHALLVLQLHSSWIVEESGHKHHLGPSTAILNVRRSMKMDEPTVFSKPVMAAMAYQARTAQRGCANLSHQVALTSCSGFWEGVGEATPIGTSWQVRFLQKADHTW